MTLIPNGRAATQSDIHALRQHLDTRFDRVEKRQDDTDRRVRALEIADARDDGRDEAVEAAQRTERAVKTEQGVSRRWQIGIAVGILTSIGVSLVGFFGR